MKNHYTMENIIKPVEVDWPRTLNLNKNSAILFRVDTSVEIGAGHLMRCLTLADELQESCGEISFICRELSCNMVEYIKTRGYQVFKLMLEPGTDQWQADAENTKKILLQHKLEPDWLVVDQYKLDKLWESAVRPLVNQIMCIDDLANREHDCDILLDQNYYKNMDSRYKGLVPENSRQLLGPKYALIRQEFKAARQSLRMRDGSIKHILIFYGGSDPTNETAKALEAIRLSNRTDITVDVVVGVANPYKDRIKELCDTMPNTQYYCQVENMAELMARADLALGAGGTATWERCYLGLPTLVTIVAENQLEMVEALAEDGVVWNLGWHGDVILEKMVEALGKVIKQTDIILCLSEKSRAIFE